MQSNHLFELHITAHDWLKTLYASFFYPFRFTLHQFIDIISSRDYFSRYCISYYKPAQLVVRIVRIGYYQVILSMFRCNWKKLWMQNIPLTRKSIFISINKVSDVFFVVEVKGQKHSLTFSSNWNQLSSLDHHWSRNVNKMLNSIRLLVQQQQSISSSFEKSPLMFIVSSCFTFKYNAEALCYFRSFCELFVYSDMFNTTTVMLCADY